jgi:A/G-specific adenine glycosylase
VLVSEVMLQQTQASRIAERFPRFMERFPTAASMAGSTDAEVLAAWSGLGYNRRAVALRRTALAVVEQGWPRDAEGLQQLPGIGPYTARAVAALAFGHPVAGVDTNVRRWLIRRMNLPVTSSPRELQGLADALAAGAADPEQAASWMHASMEFGAAVCSARRPDCAGCPVASGCPSRGRAPAVPVARQAAFAGSARDLRGRILRQLAGAPGHRLPLVRIVGVGGETTRLLEALERDGLAHRSGELLLLGARAPGSAVATIAP